MTHILCQNNATEEITQVKDIKSLISEVLFGCYNKYNKSYRNPTNSSVNKQTYPTESWWNNKCSENYSHLQFYF